MIEDSKTKIVHVVIDNLPSPQEPIQIPNPLPVRLTPESDVDVHVKPLNFRDDNDSRGGPNLPFHIMIEKEKTSQCSN